MKTFEKCLEGYYNHTTLISRGVCDMSKYVQAYFQTENDAEGAKSSLQKLAVEGEMVEAVPEEADLTPIVPLAGSTSTGGGTFTFTEVISPKHDHEEALTDKKHLTHVLHFSVEEESLEEALKIMKDHGGHVDKKLLK
ncbi:hypothetical protein D479_01040 [Halobacillus sp. BAB-2008]|nr:hypothetical protein D479_01040 [Halobacillus sp. BAB-2008]